MPKSVPLVPLPKRIAEIESVYGRAAERIVGLLSALNPETFSSIDHRRVMDEVGKIVMALNDTVGAWAPAAIRAAYEESASVARTRLELIGAKRLPERRYNPVRHDKRIGQLTRIVMRDFWKANLTIMRTARKYLAVMGQAAAGITRIRVQEFEAADALPFIKRLLKKARPADVAEASMARTSISAKIRDYLLGKLGGEDFIKIKGKDGIVRNYNAKKYAELVARTRMREAQTRAVKEMARQYDNDLVQITTHDNPCPACEEYQGNVYSISGETPGYELLPEGGPPWH